MSSINANETVVYCKGLTKQYEELVALDHLDLKIPSGHVFGYIGHNGAGKTTTIRILAGLIKSSSGKAEICGVNVDSARTEIKSLVGYMPDSFGVYDQMRVWEYLDFFGAAFSIPRKKRKDRIEYVMDITEAEYMRDRFVDTLSKGMKQRVGIARTLMHDPQVLLLDEPASGLDPKARIHMRQLIRKLADNGKTILVSSHILPELAAICDSIAVIHSGRLRASGTLQEVLGGLKRDRLMEIKCLQTAAAAGECLQADSACSAIEQSELDTNTLQFRFNGDDESLATLLHNIHKVSRVVTFREVPMSLEDAYMAISDLSDTEDDDVDASQQEQKDSDNPEATK